MVNKISLNEKILVAGAKGMVGKAICRALSKKGYGKANDGEILIPTREELDFLDVDAVKNGSQLISQRS